MILADPDLRRGMETAPEETFPAEQIAFPAPPLTITAEMTRLAQLNALRESFRSWSAKNPNAGLSADLDYDDLCLVLSVRGLRLRILAGTEHFVCRFKPHRHRAMPDGLVSIGVAILGPVDEPDQTMVRIIDKLTEGHLIGHG
jgi:hypothetical protein